LASLILWPKAKSCWVPNTEIFTDKRSGTLL
jgi:hypothetical protein